MKLTLALIRMEVKTHTSPASYIFMAWYICIYQAILMTRVWKHRWLSFCNNEFNWILSVWILCANISEHFVCSIFIAQANEKNGWDEIARVFIQVKVWLKRNLGELKGGEGVCLSQGTGCGGQRLQVEAWSKTRLQGSNSRLSEQGRGATWWYNDLTILFQEVVSFC